MPSPEPALAAPRQGQKVYHLLLLLLLPEALKVANFGLPGVTADLSSLAPLQLLSIMPVPSGSGAA